MHQAIALNQHLDVYIWVYTLNVDSFQFKWTGGGPVSLIWKAKLLKKKMKVQFCPYKYNQLDPI